MRILLRGKTDGFTFLQTLVLIIPLLFIISAFLSLYAYLLRYSGVVEQRIQNIILEENVWVESQLEK